MRHSVADKAENPDDARMFAPAAARNADAICTALGPFLPTSGQALEVASGTGEHVVKLATLAPGLIWQPTDIAAERLKSIAAWTAYTSVDNVLPPRAFNPVTDTWDQKPVDFVFLANLLHLLADQDTQLLLQTICELLAPSGTVALYGPFKRAHGFASKGDAEFDASLRLRDPAIGYKKLSWVEEQLAIHGLLERDCLSMPANNLLILWSKSDLS